MQILGFKTSCSKTKKTRKLKTIARPEVSRSHASRPRFHGLGVYSYCPKPTPAIVQILGFKTSCSKPTPAIVQILGFKTSCMLQDQENQETKDHAKPEVTRSHALKPRFHGLGVYSYCPKPTPAIVQILGFKTSCSKTKKTRKLKTIARPEVSKSNASRPRFHGLGV